MDSKCSHLISEHIYFCRSEGHLLLPKRKYPASNFAAALKRLLDGDFRYKVVGTHHIVGIITGHIVTASGEYHDRI